MIVLLPPGSQPSTQISLTYYLIPASQADRFEMIPTLRREARKARWKFNRWQVVYSVTLPPLGNVYLPHRVSVVLPKLLIYALLGLRLSPYSVFMNHISFHQVIYPNLAP
jgi:hypothetical protein